MHLVLLEQSHHRHTLQRLKMDTKKFSDFLILPGIIMLLVAGYFWYSINSSAFHDLESDAISRRAYGTDHGQTEMVISAIENAHNKMWIFGAAGGLLTFIGFGLRASSTKKND